MQRITEEKEIAVKYGLKNKREIWKAQSRLARIRDQAKRLLTLKGEEGEKQRKDLIQKMNAMGVKAKSLDDVLALDVSALLERRLETIVSKKGLVNSPKQARQMITHNHVYVGSHKVSIPSYIVLAKDEDSVRLADDIKVEKRVTEEVKKG